MANPKLATLTDAFPGTTLNATLWYIEPDAEFGGPSGSISISGGTLSLDGGNYADTNYYTSVNSQNAYDLTSSYAFVHIFPNTGNSDYDTGFALLDAEILNGIAMGVTGGDLYVQHTVSGAYDTVFSATYNAVNHAWVRISESGGTITFATSPDGATWTTFYTSTTETINTWTAATSYVQMYYGSVSGDASPSGTGGFQDFNVNATPVSGSATLAGAGTLNATGKVNVAGAAALSGTGTLHATGVVSVTAAALSGTGVMSSYAVPVIGLSGVGTMYVIAGHAGPVTAFNAVPGKARPGRATPGRTGGFAVTTSVSLSGSGTLRARASVHGTPVASGQFPFNPGLAQPGEMTPGVPTAMTMPAVVMSGKGSMRAVYFGGLVLLSGAGTLRAVTAIDQVTLAAVPAFSQPGFTTPGVPAGEAFPSLTSLSDTASASDHVTITVLMVMTGTAHGTDSMVAGQIPPGPGLWRYNGYAELVELNATPRNGGALVLIPGDYYDLVTTIPLQVRGLPYFNKTDFTETT